MMDVLWSNLASSSTLAFGEIAIRLVVALFFGVLVAVVYRMSHGRRQDESWVLTTTLVLLSVLIAMVSMVIGDSVARAFGLVGALSIVRFRTVVDDTRDTAFVMFAVIVGMAAGTGLFLAPLIGVPVVAFVAMIMNQIPKPNRKSARVPATIEVRQALGDGVVVSIAKVIEKYAVQHRIERTSTSKQGAALDVVYQVQLKDVDLLMSFVSELNRTEGVQTVDGRISKCDS
jgi:predicted PurR-regulated permease PerM